MFVSELESIRERSPELKVVIFGGVREERIAAFECLHSLKDEDPSGYIIPYPE
jgi:hypothetical protein